MNKVEEELIAANQLLRTSLAIAKRKGDETNWDPYIARLEEALTRQLPIVNALNADSTAFMVVIVDGKVRDLQGKVIGIVT